jgi:hypothetical protein
MTAGNRAQNGRLNGLTTNFDDRAWSSDHLLVETSRGFSFATDVLRCVRAGSKIGRIARSDGCSLRKGETRNNRTTAPTSRAFVRTVMEQGGGQRAADAWRCNPPSTAPAMAQGRSAPFLV